MPGRYTRLGAAVDRPHRPPAEPSTKVDKPRSARGVVAQSGGLVESGGERLTVVRIGDGRRGEHLAGEQPGIEFVNGRRPGITDPPKSSCTSRTTPITTGACGSGRCSPATADSTSPSRKCSTVRRCGPPSSIRRWRACSPPLAGRAEPGRHHHDRLARGRARRCDLRRVPLPGRVHGRAHGRPPPRHPLGPVGAYGGSDRGAATGVGRRGKRAQPALGNRHPPDPGRRQP